MNQSPMTWIGLCLVLVGLPLAVGSGASWLGGSAAMGAIAAGVCLVVVAVTLLAVSRRAEAEDRDSEYSQRLAPERQPAERRYYEEHDGHESAWAIGIVALALAAGGVALTLFAMRDKGDDDQPAGPDPIATAVVTATPSPAPSRVPSRTATATRTSEPTPVPETPVPTPAPATPAPTQPPAPTAAPRSQSQVSTNLGGRWLLTDVVEIGDDAGSTYRFTITFSHDGATLRGSGDGLVIEGVINGPTISATYTRPGGSGVFNWTLSPNGSLDGEFQDFGAQNSGSSTLTRLG